MEKTNFKFMTEIHDLDCRVTVDIDDERMGFKSVILSFFDLNTGLYHDYQLCRFEDGTTKTHRENLDSYDFPAFRQAAGKIMKMVREGYRG